MAKGNIRLIIWGMPEFPVDESNIQLVDVACRRMAMIRLMNVLSVGGSEKLILLFQHLKNCLTDYRANIYSIG